MEKQKTIKDLSVMELKATAYDHLANIEQSQIIIKTINQELASRQEATVENKEDVKEDKK